MMVVAGTEVSAMVDNDRVGRAEAATVSVGTERADHARDDSPCRTDDAREVPCFRGSCGRRQRIGSRCSLCSELITPTGGSARWLATQHASNKLNEFN